MLTEHAHIQRARALALADHPFAVDQQGNHCPGGFLTVVAAATEGQPIGFAVRVQAGWNRPKRWIACLTVEGQPREVGIRADHRCAEDAERAIRVSYLGHSGEDAHAAENISWLGVRP